MEKKHKLLLIQILGIIICVILISIILLLPILFEFTWNQALRDFMPGAEYFFRYVTELGGTLTYFAIIFTIFWAIDKNHAKCLFSIYVFGSTVNYYAKSAIANPRPPESDWILIGASHLSTPSGHTMSSTIFWGYHAIRVKRILIWLFSIIIIVLVALSRIYLGVHWFGDILSGWFFGIIVLLMAWIFEDPLRNFLSRVNMLYIYIGLAVFGLLLMIFTQILYPLAYINDFGSDGGKLIGLGLGFALEHKYVNFEINYEKGKIWKIILRVLVGIFLFLIVYIILYFLLDTSIFYIEAIHISITIVFGLFIWPLIFKKLKL